MKIYLVECRTLARLLYKVILIIPAIIYYYYLIINTGPSAFEQLFLRKIKVFEPDDTFILVWEFINSLFIILIMSLIIIDTFIEKPSWLLEDNETMLVLSISVPVLTIHYLDIFFIQFNVSYYEKF